MKVRVKRLEKYVNREEFGRKEGKKVGKESPSKQGGAGRQKVKVEMGKKGSPEKRRQVKIERYFTVKGEKEGRKEGSEERRKADI